MTLTVRQISQRSDGSDIVRTRRIEGGEATLGRAEDCDIVLPDLTLALRHARLTVLEGGKVRIEPLAGAKVRQAVIDPALAQAIDLGDHRLAFEPGAQAGEVTVTVSRTRPATGGIAEPTGVFSLRIGVFGKRPMAWILGLAVLTISLAWPIAAFHGQRTIYGQPDAQWTAGHLSQAHAFLENDCEACHQKAFVAVQDQACMTCHAAARDEAVLTRISIEVKAKGSQTAPLFIREHADHARLMQSATSKDGDWLERFKARVSDRFGRTPDRCVGCHFEHEGPAGFRPVTADDRPPIPTLKATDDCTGCHAQLRRRLPDTILIDTPGWDKHPDFHALTVHTSSGSGLTFPHDLHLSATNGVARAAQSIAQYGGPLQCADCHHPAQDGPGFAPVRMERDCAGCHSLAIGDGAGRMVLPHGNAGKVIAAIETYFGRAAAAPPPESPRRRPGLAPEAERSGLAAQGRAAGSAQASRAIQSVFSTGGLCADCHQVSGQGRAVSVAHVSFTENYLIRGGFDHRTKGHRSTDPGALPCASCHAAPGSSSAADLLLPHVEVCATCHGKPKEQAVQAAGAECSTCHSFHAPRLPARKPELAGGQPISSDR